jgi:EAL domain-containing protein (putative c-di-GMP-specific phosphodiesterase class I)/DNA-binding NarL/FixJ family response regulator
MTGDAPTGRRSGLAEAAPHVIRLEGRRRPIVDSEPPVHVLLLSADEQDRSIIPALLACAERCRFRLELVADACAGLARLATGQHDAALIDDDLPGCRGPDLVRAAIGLGTGIPLIILAGLVAPELEFEAIEAGAADVLDKEELEVGRLERAIRLAVARRERECRLAGPISRRGDRPGDMAVEPSVAGRADLGRKLARALEAGEVVAHFQPQVMLRPGELGLAALPRWHHQELGILEGCELAVLAEAVGLVEPLIDWLIGAACRQARAWRESGLDALHVAVAAPWPRKLVWSGLGRRIEAQLAAADLPASRLELELDERLLLEELDTGSAALQALHELGVRLAVGGYGAGPTSLAVLCDAPLRTVKLGHALVRGVPEDPRRAATAGLVTGLAREFGLRVVAEGVDSQDQLQRLRDGGCDAVQSPLSCPPLPAEACTEWLRVAAQRS